MTANEELRDSMISHAVYFERYKTHEVNQLFKVIDAANRAAKAEVQKTDGAATKARYQAIMKKIGQISAEARESIDGQLRLDLMDLIESESAFLPKAITSAVGVDLEMVLPAPKQVFTAATFMPFSASATFETMLNDIDSDLYSQWDMSVRVGYLTGETAKVINRRVLGSMSSLQVGTMTKFKRDLESNTRTLLAHYADQTRKAVYRENEDIIQGYQRLETLDPRTCLVCGVLDGKIYKRLEDDPGVVHMRCRGLCVPILKGWEGLGITERASVDGVVPGDTSYEDWLKKQSVDRQKDILGPSRYELFKNGAPLGSFAPDGKTLTLEQWKAAEGNRGVLSQVPNASLTRSLMKSEKEITDSGRQIFSQAIKNEQDVFDLLKKERQFGYEVDHNIKVGSIQNGKHLLSSASQFFPKDWLEKSVAASEAKPFYVDLASRGGFSPSTHDMKLDGSVSGTAHELAHRMEAVHHNIVTAEKAFYERRTQGDELQYLKDLTGIDDYGYEQTKPDKFIHPYIGKYYKNPKHYEILSYGIERLSSGQYIHDNDEDFYSFIVGLLREV